MALMIIVTISLTLLLILSGTNVQLYMVAGPGLDSALPEKVGGTIGFISNAIDSARVGDSVLRTVFLTPFLDTHKHLLFCFILLNGLSYT